MSDEYNVKCPACGAMRATTTLNRVQCYQCKFTFVARHNLTKDAVHGPIGKKEWSGFMTGLEVKNL